MHPNSHCSNLRCWQHHLLNWFKSSTNGIIKFIPPKGAFLFLFVFFLIPTNLESCNKANHTNHLCVWSSFDLLHVLYVLQNVLFVFVTNLHGHHHWCGLLVVWYCQNILSLSCIFNTSPLSQSHYGSCRGMHASQGSLVLSGMDRQPCGALRFCVSKVKL